MIRIHHAVAAEVALRDGVNVREQLVKLRAGPFAVLAQLRWVADHFYR